MTSPARWSFGVAALALLATAGLTVVGSSISRSAPRERAGGTIARAQAPRLSADVVPVAPAAPVASIATQVAAPALLVTAEPGPDVARVMRGRRQSGME